MIRLNFITDWAEKARLARYDANELARLSGVSPAHLRDYFGATFGKPTQQWLDELRRLRATRLLCAGRLVKEVARELHYADEAHFCHHFKGHYGITPLEFVSRFREQEDRQRQRLLELFGSKFDPAMLPPPPWEIAERKLCEKNNHS